MLRATRKRLKGGSVAQFEPELPDFGERSLTATEQLERKGAVASGISVRRTIKKFEAHLFLAPWFLGCIVLTAGPLIASLYLSFTSYDMLQKPVWIGIQNYVKLFTGDRRYLHALSVTFIYVFVGVPLNLIVCPSNRPVAEAEGQSVGIISRHLLFAVSARSERRRGCRVATTVQSGRRGQRRTWKH